MKNIFAAVMLVGSLWVFYSLAFSMGVAYEQSEAAWSKLTQDMEFMLLFGGAILMVAGAALSFDKGLTGPLTSLLGVIFGGLTVFTALLINAPVETWSETALNLIFVLIPTAARFAIK